MIASAPGLRCGGVPRGRWWWVVASSGGGDGVSGGVDLVCRAMRVGAGLIAETEQVHRARTHLPAADCASKVPPDDCRVVTARQCTGKIQHGGPAAQGKDWGGHGGAKRGLRTAGAAGVWAGRRTDLAGCGRPFGSASDRPPAPGHRGSDGRAPDGPRPSIPSGHRGSGRSCSRRGQAIEMSLSDAVK